MRHLATIREITEIKPIPEADLICAYRVDGWWVVDGIGKYQLGEQVIYLEVDSFVPYDLAPFLSKGKEPHVYNGVKGERLRTVKLKKQISEGLLLPVSMVVQDGVNGKDFPFITGSDVTDLLGIQKWEPPIPASLAGMMKGNFPSWLKRSDQERIENLVDEIFNDPAARFEISVKLDGSSETCYYKDGEVGVCSRNLELKLDQDGNTFIDTAKSTGLLTALQQYGRNIQVISELMGPGIQGNRENFKTHCLFVFDVFDIDTQEFLTPIERYKVITDLKNLGFKGDHVPILFNDVTLESIGITDVATSKVFVDRPSVNNKVAEGCVFKQMDGKFSFKSISHKYLLKYSE